VAHPARPHHLPEVDAPRAEQENLEIFDFELSAEEMATLDGLDKGEPGRTGPNPDTMTPRL